MISIEREHCEFGREIVLSPELTIYVQTEPCGRKYRVKISGGNEVGDKLTKTRKVKSRRLRSKT